MKNAKQKEEKYKNTNKMSVVRIMTKIIIQMYNNLQVLWSSKVKFVSLSQVLGCPLCGSNPGLFSRFYCVTCGDEKKRKDGWKKKYKVRERRSRTRKKEREEEGVKRKDNRKYNKELLKKQQNKQTKKTSLLAKPVLLVFFWLWPTQAV